VVKGKGTPKASAAEQSAAAPAAAAATDTAVRMDAPATPAHDADDPLAGEQRDPLDPLDPLALPRMYVAVEPIENRQRTEPGQLLRGEFTDDAIAHLLATGAIRVAVIATQTEAAPE
jgi:hypothetical protein